MLLPHEKFPYGPRQFKEGDPPQPAPRSMSEEDTDSFEEFRIHEEDNKSSSENSHSKESRKTDDTQPADSYGMSHKPSVTKIRRRKRSIVVSDRKVRSADVGVSGLYEVRY